MTTAPTVSTVVSGTLTTRASQAISRAAPAPIRISAHQPSTRPEFLLIRPIVPPALSAPHRYKYSAPTSTQPR
jgi:hypothetical protein